MATLTYNNVIVQGAISLDALLNLEITIKPNCHGEIRLTGIVSKDIAFTELQAKLEGTEILVLSLDEQNSTPIFNGFIRYVQTGESNGYYFAIITALSGSCKLDEEIHSRSFQDVSMTYADVVKAVLKDTSEAAAIFSVGKDRVIGKPLIQYKETDWEFFKRLASHFSSALLPDCRIGKPWFWFGMREGGDECTFSELEYQTHVSDKFYEMGGKEAGLRKSSFFYYLVHDTGNYRIGDMASFRGGNFPICEQCARFERGEIIFTYKLGHKTLIGEREYYNENITGMSLEGTVVKTDHELIWMHLDIDGNRQGTTYPYHWIPTSGNLMYCMPKLGTRASLYIPSHDEREARATNSPRINGASCPDMTDYNKRYLTTEHGKRMYWFPEMMGLVGTGSEEIPLHIMLDDVNFLMMESHGVIEIFAKYAVRVEGKRVNLLTPTELKTIRTSSDVEAKSAMIMPKGTWGGKNPPTGSGDTGITMNYETNILGVQGVLCGWDFCEYECFDDKPKNGFGWWANLVCGACVAVALATAAVITVVTGGAAAAAIIYACAAIGAGVATAAIAVADDGGKSRNFIVAMAETAGGAILGAIAGAIITMVPAAADLIAQGTFLALKSVPILNAVSVTAWSDLALSGLGVFSLLNLGFAVNDSAALGTHADYLANNMFKDNPEFYQNLRLLTSVTTMGIVQASNMNPSANVAKNAEDSPVSGHDDKKGDWVKLSRVQGGAGGTKTSKELITIQKNGFIKIENTDVMLNVSKGDDHALYFLANKRLGGYIIEFKVDKSLYDLVERYKIVQDNYKTALNNLWGMAPQMPDRSKPGLPLSLPAPWPKLIEQSAFDAKIVPQPPVFNTPIPGYSVPAIMTPLAPIDDSLEIDGDD